jgi:hypothetical protein
LHGFVAAAAWPPQMATTFAAAGTKWRQASIAARQLRGLLPIIETDGVFPMNAHAEIANTIFQVFTIAVIGVFSALALLNAAVQIV